MQHLPDAFIEPFAERLDLRCRMPVVLPEGGDPLRSGVVYLAPAAHHLRVAADGSSGYRLVLDPDPAGRLVVPSVGELFGSLAASYQGRIVAVLLTGMGDDGADEMVDLHRKGAETIAEDESTCVIYGMPRAAIERGAVKHIVTAPRIGGQIVELVGITG